MKYKYDSIILDVDGTLWDSTGIVASAWTRAIRDYAGIELDVTADMLKGLFGKPMTDIIDALLPEVPQERRYEIMEHCCEYEHTALEMDVCNICYPGVKATIKQMAEKIPVFIVSNCQSGYIELFLEKTGLGTYIADFECFGNTGKLKGDNIKLVMVRNYLKRSLYVGDTQGDREAAVYAGAAFAYASYGFGTVEKADVIIDEFGHLLREI